MLTIRLEGIKEAEKLFDPSIVRKAAASAINRVTAQARTAGINAVTERFNIKKGDLTTTSTGRGRIEFRQARANSLEAVITIKGRPISLSYFGAKQVAGNRVITRKGSRTMKRSPRGAHQGVTVEIVKGKPVRIRRSFMATVRAGNSGSHIGVFMRRGRTRLPIIDKSFVTVATLFGNENVQEAMRRVVEEKFPAIFSHELDYFSGKFR